MINIRIYCPKNHKEFETTHEVVKKAFLKHNLECRIYSITSEDIIYQTHINLLPHIVINNQVVYCGSCPKDSEMDLILKRMHLIK